MPLGLSGLRGGGDDPESSTVRPSAGGGERGHRGSAAHQSPSGASGRVVGGGTAELWPGGPDTETDKVGQQQGKFSRSGLGRRVCCGDQKRIWRQVLMESGYGTKRNFLITSVSGNVIRSWVMSPWVSVNELY